MKDNVSIYISYAVIVTIISEANSQLTIQYMSFWYINSSIFIKERALILHENL